MNTQFNQKRAIAQACKQNVAYLRNQIKAANDHDRQKQADVELRMDLENTTAALDESLDWYPGAVEDAVERNYAGKTLELTSDGYFGDLLFFGGLLLTAGTAVLVGVISAIVWTITGYDISPGTFFSIIFVPTICVSLWTIFEHWHNARVDKRRQAYNRAMQLNRSEWDMTDDWH